MLLLSVAIVCRIMLLSGLEQTDIIYTLYDLYSWPPEVWSCGRENVIPVVYLTVFQRSLGG